MRLSRAHAPWVRGAWVDGRHIVLSKPVRLSRFITQHLDRRMDLDVEYERDKSKRMVVFRVIVLPGKEKTMTRLCTNLPRTPFSLDLVARLYRFRWQIELLFKGMEVVREPAQVRHHQRAHRRRPHLGEPLRGRSQAVPRPRGAVRRWQADLHAPRRDVRQAHHRRDRDGTACLHQHCLSVPRWHGVLACQRTTL